MSKKMVLVDNDYSISIIDGDEFDDRNYERTLKSFENDVLAELMKMGHDEEYLAANAAEFLRRHGTWLYNLSKTGFAIDYAQFRHSE